MCRVDSGLKNTVEKFVSTNMERLADAAEELAELYTAVTVEGQEEKLEEILGGYCNRTPETRLQSLEYTLDELKRMTGGWVREQGWTSNWPSLSSKTYLRMSVVPLYLKISTIKKRLPRVRQAVDSYMRDHYDKPPPAHKRIADAVESIR